MFVRKLLKGRLVRFLGLICLLPPVLACSHLFPRKDSGRSTELTLTLVLSKGQYRPGEPVTTSVTLTNMTGGVLDVPGLDHDSVLFSVQPLVKDVAGELRYVDPIYSPKEVTGAVRMLQPQGGPGSSQSRTFYFTTLSFERGSYVLSAVYSQPSGGPLRPPAKTYAKAVLFTVEGEKAYAHRYLNGLISREDAIALAAAQAGAKPEASDTLLVTDEQGFYKWWINLTVNGKVRSWFVDPYFARVWQEAIPFTAADKGIEPPLAPDSKVLQRLKEQSIQKRER